MIEQIKDKEISEVKPENYSNDYIWALKENLEIDYEWILKTTKQKLEAAFPNALNNITDFSVTIIYKENDLVKYRIRIHDNRIIVINQLAWYWSRSWLGKKSWSTAIGKSGPKKFDLSEFEEWIDNIIHNAWKCEIEYDWRWFKQKTSE